MYSNTHFGDYPHYAPAVEGKAGAFTGWMLLSYKKPVKASSAVGNFTAAAATDENVKSFWRAAKNDSTQWLEIDLQSPCKVFAIQVNYHDYKSDLYGKDLSLRHNYFVEGSMDGQNWNMLVNRRNSFKDVPNDYVELAVPATVRYIRYNNIKVPTPHLAISGLRVFGNGSGKAPTVVKAFAVKRQTDRRNAMITWAPQPNTQGYNVYWGIAPDKLYNSWMVYDKSELLLKSFSVDQSYYFAIEAFNENGVSAKSSVAQVK